MSCTIDQIHPRSSADDVRRALDNPAVKRVDDEWWRWSNVRSGFHQACDDRLKQLPPFPKPHDPRGIVIVGGGSYLPSVYVTVRVLRHLGCTLPIEQWHFADEEDPQLFEAIAEHGVDFVNATQLSERFRFRFLDWHWWKGWQLKSFALCNSRFRQVLLLDADCYPNRNPEYLFDWPEFQSKGAVFWPDVNGSPTVVNDDVLSLFRISEPEGRLAESGQMLVDRERCWRPLQLAAQFNECADLVYHYVWGDKDTFPFAWGHAGVPYARMWPHCQVESDCLLQLDFEGHVIFQHRVGDKFRLPGNEFSSTKQFGIGESISQFARS